MTRKYVSLKYEPASEPLHRFIACMGTGDEVPVYLRYHGHVRNRKMQKREAEKTIREIWCLSSQEIVHFSP